MSFPQMLKQLREENNLAQNDVAEYLGMTRQAIASYELGKREPDFNVLIKLADLFKVSLDYLLGRVTCRETNAVTIGRNIELIRGSLSYEDFSDDIGRKTGVIIFPEMLELYAKAKRIPYSGAISILAKYAGVSQSFFNVPNTLDTLRKERELHFKESEQSDSGKSNKYTIEMFCSNHRELSQWITKEGSIQYLRLAKQIQEARLPAEALRPFIENIKKLKNG